MLESKVEARFTRRAAEQGCEQRKLTYPGRRNATDRLLIAPVNRVFFVELKQPGKTARPAQAREHARLRRVGADVRVLDTIEAVDTFFDSIAWEHDHA
jgi:hypothetical protein